MKGRTQKISVTIMEFEQTQHYYALPITSTFEQFLSVGKKTLLLFTLEIVVSISANKWCAVNGLKHAKPLVWC